MSGSPPVVVEQRVACAPEHAFRVWTERLDLWWPRDKSFAGPDRLARVVLEPGVGGRIHEVDLDGGTEEGGRVVAWEPPHRLAFTWHLMFRPRMRPTSRSPSPQPGRLDRRAVGPRRRSCASVTAAT